MTIDPGTASRLQAIRMLVRWLERRDFPDRMLPDTPDRGFVMDLVYGTVRGWRRLEWALAFSVKRRPTAELRAALLLGAQQILFMPDVADHAALHATVEAAKHGVSGQSGFVNAVLRTVLRQRESLLAELAAQPLAVRASHPDALVDRWVRVLGAGAAAAICDWDNTPAETIVAVVPSCGVTAADLLDRWRAAGAAARPHATEAACLVLGRGTRLEDLEGYAQGWFVPQDPATLAAQQRRLLANLLPSLAPGGVLVYSTCSIEPEENQELVAAACAGQDEYARGAIHMQRPGDDDMDGAFACAIRRKPLESAACSPV